MRKISLTGDPLIPLVVILGATATGKTTLGIALANALDGEIINADSRQIYRQMSIGTAKPTHDEQAQAVHHLIDVVDPDQTLNMAEYVERAKQRIADIHGRGKLPLLVGGTGQYITALTEGWTAPQVAPDMAFRADLEQFAAQHSPQALHDRLHQHDPLAASAIDPRNVRRVIRALEVIHITGKPYSAQRVKLATPFRVLFHGLALDRAVHYPRADSRFDHMIADGLVEEVQALLNNGYAPQLPAMSGIGYAQIVRYLHGQIALPQAIQEAKFATHQFIRKQATWFRGHDHGILWHNSAQLSVNAVIATTHTWLTSGG
jgi:tRNA dimethylallyltransferase